MSTEEFMKWMEEWNRKREADHLERMKEMDGEREERNRKREAYHNEYMERSHQEHLK